MIAQRRPVVVPASPRSAARRSAARALVAALCALSACGPCDAPPPPEEPLRRDVGLGAGAVRCGPVTRESELIGGPAAYGQTGRGFRCMNARIRFFVQDGSRPVGNSSVGGTLIDLDRVRPDERVDGEDTFREHASAFGGHEIDIERIEVVNDGRDGSPGVVRVTGRPGAVTMAPGAVHLRQEMTARLQTEYILAPDVDWVEVRTTIFNEGDDQLQGILFADFLALGSLSPFTPKTGFGEAPLFSQAPFLGQARGEHVSYGYVCAEDDPTLVVHDQAVSVVLCRDQPFIAREASYSRFLVVGDGTVESVSRHAYALRGLPTGALEGVVRDEAGAPAAGVLVAALSGPLDDADASVVNEARTDAEGRYRLTLPPGAYVVVAHAPARARGAPVEVAVDEAGAEADLTIGGSGLLRVATTFTDRRGQLVGPMPAKLTIEALDPQNRRHAALDEGPPSYAVSVDGALELALPAGAFRVHVTRGFEWTRSSTEVSVEVGETAEVQAAIRHVLDTEGLVGAEFHQHTLGSVDATVPYPVKVLENAAEGVELAASTDHDNVVDFAPWVESLGLSDVLAVVAGNEVTYSGIGHFNVYPWRVDPADRFKDNGSRMWWGKTIPEVFADARAAAGDPVVQVNHPRDGNMGYFASLGLDPTDATRIPRDPPRIPTLPPTIYSDWTGAFDAVEVNGALGEPALFTDEGQEVLRERARSASTDVPPFADYLALLGAGMPVSALGNSDTHRPNGGVGFPRNFLRVGKDAPSALVEDDLRAAIRGQDVSVGNGCLVELYAGGERRMGKDEAVVGAPLDVRVRLQAPPHVTVERLELYVNGRARPLALFDGAIELDDAGALSLPLDPSLARDDVERASAPLVGLPAGDLAIVAVARGGEGLAPTGGGRPFCYSAPLYVDAEGDGWRGWLEDTEQVR